MRGTDSTVFTVAADQLVDRGRSDHTQEDSAGRIRKITQRFGYDAWIFVGKTKLDAFQALRDCAATLQTRNVVFTPKPIG
jgi:hypothetical protein